MADAPTLLGRLAEHAQTRPEETALVLGADEVSYAELHAMALTALGQLEELNLAPQSRVAIHAVKTPQTIALIIACLRARLQFLLPSPELGEGTFTGLLDRAEVGVVLATEAPPAAAGRTVYEVDCTPRVGLVRPVPPSDGTEDEISFMLTTSGSTGLPKVVPLTVGAVDRFTDWAAEEFTIEPGTAVLNYAPLNFDLCLLDIWATLKAGGTVVLVDQEKSTNGAHLAELLRTNKISVVQSVPMLYRLLADAWDGRPFTGVRNAIVTGDKVSARLLKELPEMFPWAAVWNLYGCTETNDSFLYRIPRESGDAVPIGTPITGVEALVCSDDGVILEGPATGELYVRTPFQTAGYLDTAVAADKFVRVEGRPDPYFRSGDLVERDADGVYTLLGRNDFQVKVRGTRVNLEEIEHIIGDHEDVVEAAVIGIPDELAGVRIHAVVRGIGPGKPNSLKLRDHCRLRLPRVAIPSAIQIVPEPLPRTSTGKIDRQAIRRTILNRS